MDDDESTDFSKREFSRNSRNYISSPSSSAFARERKSSTLELFRQRSNSSLDSVPNVPLPPPPAYNEIGLPPSPLSALNRADRVLLGVPQLAPPVLVFGSRRDSSTRLPVRDVIPPPPLSLPPPLQAPPQGQGPVSSTSPHLISPRLRLPPLSPPPLSPQTTGAGTASKAARDRVSSAASFAVTKRPGFALLPLRSGALILRLHAFRLHPSDEVRCFFFRCDT